MVAQDILWDSIKARVFCTRAQFDAMLTDWQVIGIERGGELAAAVMLKKGELHCAVRPEFRGRWLSRRLLAQLQPGMHCATEKHNLLARRFIERLGFQLMHEDTYDAHYRLPQDLPVARRFPRAGG